MFTGLIEELGIVERVEKKGEYLILTIQSSFNDIKPRDSINVDGACLTVISTSAGKFTVEVSPETQNKTTIGKLKVGSKVNLERAMRLGDRLGGHLVLGHVDGVGKIVYKKEEGRFLILKIEVDRELSKFLIPKGSIAVNGVSLTINEVFENRFKVGIIPYTLEITNLKWLKIGDFVNIETDIIGKYVATLMKKESSTSGINGITEDLLERAGFIKGRR